MIENQTQLDADKQHQVETFGELQLAQPAVNTLPPYVLAMCDCEWCKRFNDMDKPGVR